MASWIRLVVGLTLLGRLKGDADQRQEEPSRLPCALLERGSLVERRQQPWRVGGGGGGGGGGLGSHIVDLLRSSAPLPSLPRPGREDGRPRLSLPSSSSSLRTLGAAPPQQQQQQQQQRRPLPGQADSSYAEVRVTTTLVKLVPLLVALSSTSTSSLLQRPDHAPFQPDHAPLQPDHTHQHIRLLLRGPTLPQELALSHPLVGWDRGLVLNNGPEEARWGEDLVRRPGRRFPGNDNGFRHND